MFLFGIFVDYFVVKYMEVKIGVFVYFLLEGGYERFYYLEWYFRLDCVFVVEIIVVIESGNDSYLSINVFIIILEGGKY